MIRGRLNWKHKEMKMKIWIKPILLGLWLLIWCFSFVMMHEYAHQQIFREYGIDSKIEPHFWYFATVPTTENSENLCNEKCEEMHMANEIIGYPLGVIVLLLSLLSFNSMSQIITRWERND